MQCRSSFCWLPSSVLALVVSRCISAREEGGKARLIIRQCTARQGDRTDRYVHQKLERRKKGIIYGGEGESNGTTTPNLGRQRGTARESCRNRTPWGGRLRQKRSMTLSRAKARRRGGPRAAAKRRGKVVEVREQGHRCQRCGRRGRGLRRGRMGSRAMRRKASMRRPRRRRTSRRKGRRERTSRGTPCTVVRMLLLHTSRTVRRG